jgi:hypothetical protein
MPKTLYLSPRELALVTHALELYAAEPDKHPLHVRDSSERAFAAILAGYAHNVAESDDFDADRLRDQWYAHLRPDLTPCVPPSEQEPATWTT